MNQITIIGNLTKDPVLRVTNNGKEVCTFTIAVNRKHKVEGQPEADFFNVNAWGELGKNCNQYLAKGRKAAVVGSVSVRSYQRQDGEAGASLEVFAESVEFLTPKNTAYSPVNDADNPFA